MVKSRSRSPPGRRERRRSRSRSRERDRDRDRERDRARDRDRRSHRGKDRHRSRSRSPHRPRSRSPRRRLSISRSRSRSKEAGGTVRDVHARPPIDEADLEGKTEEEIEMIKLMGFTNFDTTKGKRVVNNNSSAVNIIHKRKYRQYMNRKGGFNRPLDFVA